MPDQTPAYRPFVNRRYDPAKDPANIAASTGPDEPTHPSMADPDLMANAEGDKKALRRARDLKQPASALSPKRRPQYPPTWCDAHDCRISECRDQPHAEEPPLDPRPATWRRGCRKCGEWIVTPSRSDFDEWLDYHSHSRRPNPALDSRGILDV